MTNGKIPFLDLITPHEELREELTTVFSTVLKTGGFVGGAMVDAFEKEFAEFCGSRYCIGVGNGTDAVRFALMAAGIKKDSVVVTVPNTFIATTEAITQAGAHPDFVDVNERTYNMDAEKLREYLEVQCYMDPASGELINRKSGRPLAAIVPVHLYGQTVDMDAICELAGRYNLPVIEDSCQAHGADYYSAKEGRWRRAGTMGKAAAFSFYPGKNLGACGEGGAVTTDDADVAQRIRMLRDHGQSQKYYHDIEGYNGRLDALQAGILSVKLRQLTAWNQDRCQSALRYREMFGDAEAIVLPHVPSWSRPVYHLYVVRVADRDRLQKQLAAANIGTGIHYPVPLHLQKAYEGLGYAAGDFPVAEKASSEVLSLPMFPGLTEEMQQAVVEQTLEQVSKARVLAAAE